MTPIINSPLAADDKTIIVETLVTALGPLMSLKLCEFVLKNHFSSESSPLKKISNATDLGQKGINATLGNLILKKLNNVDTSKLENLSNFLRAHKVSSQQYAIRKDRSLDKLALKLCIETVSPQTIEEGMRAILKAQIEGDPTPATGIIIDEISKRLQEICVTKLR